MNSNFLTFSRSVFLGLAFIAIFSVAQKSVRADPVTYSTSGTFTGGGSSVTFTSSPGNTLTVSYTAIGPVTVNSPTTASFGDIKTSVTGSGATIGSGIQLTIAITQTVPGPTGNNSFVGMLTGTISQNSASMNSQIVFTVTSFTINGVTYTIDPSYHLVPPSTNNGVTSVQGTIVGPTSVPEPAALLLFATGLTGAAGFGRKRLRRR